MSVFFLKKNWKIEEEKNLMPTTPTNLNGIIHYFLFFLNTTLNVGFFSDDLHLEPCCQYAFYRMKQFLPGDKEEEKDEVDDFGPSSFNRMRKFIWELFEEPNKTKLGKVQPSYFKTIRHDIIFAPQVL